MSRRLLLLDDDAAIVAVVRRYFSGKGWQVVSCAEAKAALLQVESDEVFDAIICDLHFTPARLAEGLEIIERARRRRPGSTLVLFTGATEDHLRREALRRGADEVLTKPAPLARLHDAAVRGMKTA